MYNMKTYLRVTKPPPPPPPTNICTASKMNRGPKETQQITMEEMNYTQQQVSILDRYFNLYISATLTGFAIVPECGEPCDHRRVEWPAHGNAWKYIIIRAAGATSYTHTSSHQDHSLPTNSKPLSSFTKTIPEVRKIAQYCSDASPYCKYIPPGSAHCLVGLSNTAAMPHRPASTYHQEVHIAS